MIPQHYPIEPGTIYGGEYPGDINAAVASWICFLPVQSRIGKRAACGVFSGKDRGDMK